MVSPLVSQLRSQQLPYDSIQKDHNPMILVPNWTPNTAYLHLFNPFRKFQRLSVFVPEILYHYINTNNNIPALVQIMAWRPPGDKPLSDSSMVRLSTHLCVTRPQWVKCQGLTSVNSSVPKVMCQLLISMYICQILSIAWTALYLEIGCILWPKLHK